MKLIIYNWPKILIVILINLFIYFKLPHLFPTYAEWTRYNGNPILEATTSSWDSLHVMPGTIIYENNIFKLWYTGGSPGNIWRVSLAKSTDGIHNWEKTGNPILPIGSSDGWETASGDPFVIHNDANYIMYFTAVGPTWVTGEDRFRAGYATSQNGENWEKASNWILKGTPGKWDSGGIARGISVLKTDKGYEMWFAATNDATMGTPEEKWGIGYAFSTDGINWTKNEEPVLTQTEPWELNYISYPYVIYEAGYYHMFYTATQINLPASIVYAYSSDGVNWTKPENINPILHITPQMGFDHINICSPVVYKISDNNYRLYYSGLDGYNWKIGFAEGSLPVLPPPTPPGDLDPIILLPGLGASWNHEHMLFGTPKPQAEWKMTPGAKIYNGLIQTLINSGYQTDGPNRNLFIFNYNWTQNVDKTIEELKSYIQNVVQPGSGVKIDLIGHSLGGLTARTFFQKYPESPIDQIVTLGSPHQGVPHVYYAWEGGDYNSSLDSWPIWQKIGLGLIVHIRRHLFETQMDTVHNVAPVIKDLLPTFNYLKENNQPKPVTSLNQQNTWLTETNSQISSELLSKFNPISATLANPDNTVRWIPVTKPNYFENLLGFWQDGKPVGKAINGDGDNTTLTSSATLPSANSFDFDNLDHIDLVTNTQSINKITQTLGLSPSSIVPGEKIASPVLVFQLASPATISIIDPDGNTIPSVDNLIIINSAKPGKYQVKLTGTGNGVFHLYTGQITDTKNIWDTQLGKINLNQEIIYTLNFNPENLQPITYETNFKNNALTRLEEIKTNIDLLPLGVMTKAGLSLQLKLIKLAIEKNQIEESIKLLYLLKIDLNKKSTITLNNQILDLINLLEKYYIISNSKVTPYNRTRLNNEIRASERNYQTLEKRLIKMNLTDKQIGVDMQLALQKLNQAKNTSSYESHINALSTEYLLKEIQNLLK